MWPPFVREPKGMTPGIECGGISAFHSWSGPRALIGQRARPLRAIELSRCRLSTSQ